VRYVENLSPVEAVLDDGPREGGKFRHNPDRAEIELQRGRSPSRRVRR
jgi:hypothetical protein